MYFNKNILSQAHNWLLYHYYLKNILKCLPYLKGKILDVGCGRKPYEYLFKENAGLYLGVEYMKTIHGFEKVDVAADSLALPFVKDSFDSVVTFQVMEHVPEPKLFLIEACRVLKPGGYMLVTTPFMWGEHEEPYDFFRYTRYGLRYLAEKAGFEVVSITPDTKFWSMAALRLNYYLLRFARGPLKGLIKLLLYPVFFFSQILAFLLDKVPHNYTCDTTSFTTLLRKPS